MATDAVRPDSVRANPEPTTSDSIRHSRRTALTLLATPAIGLALPMLAASCTPQARAARTGGSGWDVALATYRQTQERSTAYEQAIYEPAYQRRQAALAAVPHVAVPYRDDADIAHEMRSDDEWSLWRLKQYRRDQRREPESLAPIYIVFEQGLARRNEARKAILEEPTFAVIFDRSSALDEAAAEAFHAALAARVLTIGELLQKAEMIVESGTEEDEGSFSTVLADIRRLAGETL